MRKLLFRSRSGEGYPMVIAVTLCLLMLFMVIAEYFRVNIIVQGVRDAVQQAVIATVNENYDDVYHSVREGYAAGWFPEGGYLATATLHLEIPTHFAGRVLPPVSLNLQVQAKYIPKF